jgi:adenosylhomocysteine nucleosidase
MEQVELLIQGAADWELEPLIDALSGRRESRTHIWTCWCGEIDGRNIAVQRTDWGPVNVSAATLSAIDRLHPCAIVSQGMAGAHNPELRIGDIIVAERTVDHGAYKSAPRRTGEGLNPGEWIPISHRFRVRGGDLVEFPSFPSNPALARAALAGGNPHGRLVRGVGGSAYQYNREADLLRALRRTFGTDCEDMESAFAAGVAAALEIPFVAIRMISNNELTGERLDKSAGFKCAMFVRTVIATMSL